MDFEFDSNKSQINFKKHGIGFEEAKSLWDDPDFIEAYRVQDEPRFLAIGKIKDDVWSAVITYRNTKIRIISVRRARPEEVAIYES